MFQSKKFVLSIMVLITFLLGGTYQALALTLFPPDSPLIPIDFGPTVLKTSPTSDERVVFPVLSSSGIPQITILFDQDIRNTATPATDAVKIYNTTDSIRIHPTAVRSLGNALIIDTGGLAMDKTFTVNVYGMMISNGDGSWNMHDVYTWSFSTAADGLVGTFPPMPSEPYNTALLVEKSAITPTVNMIGSVGATAKYKISVNNTGAYNLDSVDIIDILPKGFSFNSLTAGDSTSATGTRIVHFTIPNVARGATKRVEFLVNIDGSSASTGNYIVPAGTYNNFAIATGTFVPAGSYSIPIITGASNGESNADNVTINRIPLLSPTFTLPPDTLPTSFFTPSGSPTSSSSPIPSPVTTIFAHPATDPLTCLRLNGATALSFRDVPGSAAEAPYVNFLNTTVFNSDRDIRLSRGYADGTFGMNNTLTRFELTKMALGANCINYNSSPTRNTFFTDVPTDDSEISLVIGKARALGIVQGVGNQFYPNRPVSYGEMVKILVGSGTYFDRGTARTPLAHMLSGITDESFRQFAEHAARMNLVNLGPSNSFPQNDFVLRRFMAQAVARYIAWLKNISLV